MKWHLTGITILEKFNGKLYEACYRDNLHSLWAGQELYRRGNSEEEFINILQKNMQPVYDSARRQGYEVWDSGWVMEMSLVICQINIKISLDIRQATI